MSRLIDLTGQKFGRLTVIEKDKSRITQNGSYWLCQCECGKTKSVKSSSLRRGEILSCGCLRNERSKKAKEDMGLVDNLINQRFGFLTVVAKSEQKGNGGEIMWDCICDCGGRKTVRGHDLKRKDGNQTVSCGCKHMSQGEIKIRQVLEENNISFIQEYSFIGLPKSRFDFAIILGEEVIRLIEFDGEQHFKEVSSWCGLEKIQERDKIKNDFSKEKNIPLVRIPYWELENINLDMLFSSTYEVREVGQSTG